MARRKNKSGFDWNGLFRQAGGEISQDVLARAIGSMDPARVADPDSMLDHLAAGLVKADRNKRAGFMHTAAAALRFHKGIPAPVRNYMPDVLEATNEGINQFLAANPDASQTAVATELKRLAQASGKLDEANKKDAWRERKAGSSWHYEHNVDCDATMPGDAVRSTVARALRSKQHGVCPLCYGDFVAAAKSDAAEAGKDTGPSLVDVATATHAQLLAAYDEILSLRGLDLIHEPTGYAMLNFASDKGLTKSPKAVKFLPTDLESSDVDAIWAACRILRRQHEGMDPVPSDNELNQARTTLLKAVRAFASYTAIVRREGEATLEGLQWWIQIPLRIMDHMDDRWTDEERKRFRQAREKLVKAVEEQDWAGIRDWFANWAHLIFGEVGVWIKWGYVWTKRVAFWSWVPFLVLTATLLFVDPIVQGLLGNPGGWFNAFYQRGDTLYFNLWPLAMVFALVLYIISGVGTFMTRFILAGWGKIIGAIINLVQGEKPPQLNPFYYFFVKSAQNGLKQVGLLKEDEGLVVTTTRTRLEAKLEPLVDIATTSTIISMITVILVMAVYFIAGIFGQWWIHLMLAILAAGVGAVIGLMADAMKRFRSRNKVEWQFLDVFRLKQWLFRLLLVGAVGMPVAGFGLGTIDFAMDGLSSAACRAKYSDPVEEAYFCDDSIRSMRPALLGPNFLIFDDRPATPDSVKKGKKQARSWR